ncbi:30S ribosome-binding factor RbfA [Patescibacteria group bacterium]|nr:30S ribosome-binding factor RbfA [Patescibacteria group bacterium]
MTSHRLSQVNKLIQEEFNLIVLREVEFPGSYLVTVEKVETAPDLKHCLIWLSVLPINFRKEAMALLKKNQRKIQSMLFKKMFLKFVPKISFRIDESEEKADRINRILDKHN